MLNNKIEQALNDQANFELESADLYLAMSSYFASINLPGFARWMRIQYQEEVTHGLKMMDYINDRNGRVLLKGRSAPKAEWSSPLDAFSAALKHEELVTSRINSLVDLSISERDHATNQFLQWYVAEQVEEEATAQGIIDKLKMVKESAGSIFYIDKELGSRQGD